LADAKTKKICQKKGMPIGREGLVALGRRKMRPTGTMDRRFSINGSAVASEVIDGEAIMMHQVSGDYFSADGVGCLIWQWIGDGRSRNQMLDLLNERFAGEPAEIASTVESVLADLLSHPLVFEVDQSDSPPPGPVAETSTDPGVTYAPPILSVYSDMRDLLLLDPIHEVEDSGWPTPKRTGTEP
jgi:hypothetical protein